MSGARRDRTDDLPESIRDALSIFYWLTPQYISCFSSIWFHILFSWLRYESEILQYTLAAKEFLILLKMNNRNCVGLYVWPSCPYVQYNIYLVKHYKLYKQNITWWVEPDGIEPTTSWMPFKRSPNWAMAPFLISINFFQTTFPKTFGTLTQLSYLSVEVST